MKLPIKILTAALLLTICLPSGAENISVKEFKSCCDSLSTLLGKRTGVRKVKLQLKNVMKREGKIDFYFTETIGDFPWKEADIEWFREQFGKLMPRRYRETEIGEIMCKTRPLPLYVTPPLGKNGKPVESKYKVDDRRDKTVPIVRRCAQDWFAKGLSGRNIALWQSHGNYYESSEGRWIWQRAPLFTTVEDAFTQMYVVPYLVPMLENSGANVFLPRERDFNPYEVIVDNDGGQTSRIRGEYMEKGSWTSVGKGFADSRETYEDESNPFASGSARKAVQIKTVSPEAYNDSWNGAAAVWTPDIPVRRPYAVYVSYQTVSGSSTCAHYTVHHLGGNSHFIVNQTIGGGTWVYLGTFEFDKGCEGYVSLDNGTPEGKRSVAGKIITADAVRFGGGMGCIARGADPADSTGQAPSVSGRPRYLEGARYWLQWAGYDKSVWRHSKNSSDYVDDYAGRGPWVNSLSGGSAVNPKARGKGVPVDLSFAWHSDAGISPTDKIIGTLSIYTLEKDGKDKFPDESSRWANRELAELVQSQLVSDVRKIHCPEWTRRQIWDRSYSESRTPDVPAMLLEFLSHQNAADMRYGLDPAFRFTVARAVYKGMLKFLSNRYGCNYAVQPLPVNSFTASFNSDGTKAVLEWKSTSDPLEPTAVPTSYKVYVRVDDGGFADPLTVKGTRTEIAVEPGHIYSFKVTAANAGGESFPTEVLAVGKPECPSSDGTVLVVNNFDRVGGPFFRLSENIGYINENIDCGVPDKVEAGYIGEMYDWERNNPWESDDCPGFGASYNDFAGRLIAGNSFDYPYIHGRMILAAGKAFCSASSEGFISSSDIYENADAIDLICGKQLSTVTGYGKDGVHWRVFTPEMQTVLRRCTTMGKNLLVSGANIGTDIWQNVFQVPSDSSFTAASKAFATEVLGYRLITNRASRRGAVWTSSNKAGFKGRGLEFGFNTVYDENFYRVESPDALAPSGDASSTILRYRENNVSAGICHQGDGYRTVCIGFPLESIRDEKAAEELMESILTYFDTDDKETSGNN